MWSHRACCVPSVELGLSESSQGILELPKTCAPGTNVYDCLDLEDTVIDIDLTPNRSDCLSIRGLAREVSALFEVPVEGAPGPEIGHSIDQVFPVSLEAPEDCPRYVGRVITNVAGELMAPLWIQEKLRRCGVRSVNAVTDITNYVMLELGQPMHAFDLDRLHSGIVVRFARPSESLQLLNGQEVKLSEDELVIAGCTTPGGPSRHHGGTAHGGGGPNPVSVSGMRLVQARDDHGQGTPVRPAHGFVPPVRAGRGPGSGT